MSTMNIAVPAITLTDDQLDPYVTHAATRGWLTGHGLPGASGLFTFEGLRDRGLRTVADSAGAAVSPELRDQLVIGALRAPGAVDAGSILLDGATGAVATTSFLPGHPELMDRAPLAPSLCTLVSFATAADELAGLRGRFASFAGRSGPKAAAEASRKLLEVFEEGTDGELSPFWRMTALIRPLSLVPAPGAASGLALELPGRLLDQEFGQGAVWRFEEVDFPPTLTHGPTRRFLRETGLPESGPLFQLDTDAPLPTLREHHAQDDAEDGVELPLRADQLIRLGYLAEDHSLVVDGETGAVLTFSEPEATLTPLNTDLSTLAFTLWLLHREKALDGALSHALTTEAYDQLATTMLQTLATIDPTAVSLPPTDWHYWTEAFQDEAGGAL
ncbi:SUKH-4 family immunity protein [Streptomyces sp. NPDC087425]|uniref:SUKH-4 family immunity protein n=1 Tax=Streptomyces sp. NPDC087425 TaxID=3365787 RepID=UPI0037FF88A8